MKCLDTTFLIDVLRNDKDAFKKASEIESDNIVTTSINFFECVLGIHLEKEGNKELKMQKFKDMILNINILPFNIKSSFIASKIAADLIKKGQKIDDLDNLIAGTMLANNCNIVVTRDIKHFKRIKGIKVESY
ncbi:MAG: type II toxin-antitoxin system VapC family toxin [Candidatus Nanoarchaeia archaeon]